MRIAIIGDGATERAWADGLAARGGVEVVRATDLDVAADMVVLGGPVCARAEILRRAAADGPVAICLHPPGPDDLAYLQAAGRVVPDLPMRLHPAVDRLRRALDDGSLGEFRAIEHRVPAPDDDLLDAFARSVDVLRALLGEFDTLTASGDPEGPAPEYDLLVRLRARSGRLAELRIVRDDELIARLTARGSLGSLLLRYERVEMAHARLDRRPDGGRGEDFTWSPHAALLDAIGSPRAPSLEDGIRAMELAQAARRSLRLGRAVEVRPAHLTAEAAFKSSMATAGCLLLLGSVALFAAASVARALGIESAARLVYVIPAALAVFLVAAWAGKTGDASKVPSSAGKGRPPSGGRGSPDLHAQARSGAINP